MEPISGADRLVALLRQKLEERARSATNRAGKSQAKTSPDPAGIQALAAGEGYDERQLRRAFVQHLLAEHFGAPLVNDANFQQLVTRVTESIDEEPSTAKLLSQLISDLWPR